MIRDILMFTFAFAGLGVICRVKIDFLKRTQKHPEQADAYSPDEAKLRKIGFILVGIALILAFLPTKYTF